MIYLIGKRNIIRVQRQQTIIAFSNQPEAELFVNGKSCGKVETDRYSILEWKHVILTPGKNKIEVKTTNKKTDTDRYVLLHFMKSIYYTGLNTSNGQEKVIL